MYNYLDDAIGGIDFRNPKDYKICSDEKKNCLIKATICGKCYQDPDAVSEKLYDDLREIFNKSDLGKKYKFHVAHHSSQLYLQYDQDYNHELSVDYIGPSRANALSYLNGEIEEKANRIGEFLLTSRTIGGHVLWPAHQINRNMTINQIRGKKHGIYDRIDITLAELQHFYNTNGNGIAEFSQPLYDAFKRYKWFFDDCFGSFENFIKYMNLDMFLHNKNVISLADSDVKNEIFINVSNYNADFKPSNYSNFIENCTELIRIRSEKMNEFLNSDNTKDN